MKKSLLFICAMLLGTLAFATGFSKDSPQLNALANTWKSPASTFAQKQDIINNRDITIVYGGQDMAGKANVPVLAVA